MHTLAVILSFAVTTLAAKTCNVLDYGAQANNSTDLGPALTQAYTNCVKGSTTSSPADTVILVPSGNFLLASGVEFSSASDFTLTISGNIYLPFDPNLAGNMLFWEHCNNVVVNGNGAIYGNGYRYREGGNLSLYPNRPRLIRFENSNNIEITGVTLYDAPMFHVTIIGNNNVAHNMAIIASHIGETDGFDVSGDNNYVHDVSVENGDECVTVKTPTNGFVGENIQCINGAGCNVGSFGDGTTGVSIQNVTYTTVSLSYSDAGVMIKSYPNCQGTIENLSYNDFTLNEVAYPIDIDMYWCGGSSNCPSQGSGSQTVNNIQFNNFQGSGTSTRPGVKLNCLSNTPCRDIAFNNVQISGAKAATVSNACGSGLSGLNGC
ncbi:glycoside hydrolase family 28 protein [Plicaturopsis crispa FD-325 SS-3]|nr:glycoside hydrolase family 28 protein [Plicaturopsis crispa FD-325 SS-3]